MKARLRPLPAAGAGLLSVLGSAVHGWGFLATDLQFARLANGLGFLTPLLMVGPLGLGLLAVGLLEAAAAAGMFAGAIMLLARRRTGIWVTMVACAPALVAGLLLVSGIVPAPLVFGKTMAGLPTVAFAWTICASALITATGTVTLAVSRPARVR